MRSASSLQELEWGDGPGFVFMLGDVPAKCRRILRLLPGKRVSLECEVKGQRRFVKVFWGKLVRDGKREAALQKRLASLDIRVPAVIEEGGDGGTRWLVCEWLEGRVPGFADPREVRAVLNSIVLLHARGWLQTDPHVDNFLIDGAGRVFLLDPGSIRPARGTPLVRALAGFAAQAPVGHAPEVEAQCLVVMEGKRLKKLLFSFYLRHIRRRRIRHLLRKQLRSTSSLVRLMENGCVTMADRALATPDLDMIRACAAKDEWQREIKHGRSASVYMQEQYIAKVYYHKSIGQRIRSAVGLSRAQRSWVFGRALLGLGVATARPVLLSRCADGREILVMEGAHGPLLSHILEGQTLEVEPAWRAARNELARMHKLGFIHGDAKAQNYVITDGGAVVIDLDACRWLSCTLWKRFEARRERARFEHNLIQFRPGGGAA